MIKTLSKCLAMGLILVFTFTLFGCGSETGGTEEELVLQAFDEQCIFCHGPGRSQDVAEVHTVATNSPQVTITGVTIVGFTVTVAFRIVDSDNNLVPLSIPANDIRFTIAQLVPPLVDSGDSSTWQSYINRTETKAEGDPGTTDDDTTKIQATAERANTAGGTFTDHQDGSYEYVFSFKINEVTDPIPVTYNASRTHRVAMQVSDNVDNAFLDFVPDSGAGATRDIAMNESCNECHLKLGFHGGDRIALKYCVTCHNPGSTDANSGNTIDFKVMVHKIHYGENLPSVEAGGEYAIWGHNDTKHDYSDVVFPQDVRNCTKCHDGADAGTPDGHNWKEVPTRKA